MSIVQLSGKRGDELPFDLLATVLAVTSALSLVGLILLVIGLTRHRRLGGLGYAIWNLWLAVPLFIGTLLILIFAISKTTGG